MQSIQALVAPELTTLSAQLQTLVSSDNRLLQEVTQYAFRVPGKQIRPILVLLTAGACGGITPKAQRGALLVTLLHQASLVHDDVVDGATYRRGQPAIHVAWNEKVAILFGDYLLAKISELALQHQDDKWLDLLNKAFQAMSEGELLHLAQAAQCTISEEMYLEVIHKKTAYLLGVCFAMGALGAGAPAAQVDALCQAGEDLGMAFQLKDDGLDYGTKEQGKPLGLDLQAGYLTLPLIHALQQASTTRRQEVLHILQHHSNDAGKRQEVMDFVRQSAGITYTHQKMHQYRQKALDTLNQLETSPYQQALIALVQDIV
ncbi:MAG: polyprenyl synthetase family protein [Bacteroidota bacterium]